MIVLWSRMASYNYRPYHYINSLILIIFGCVKNVGGYEFMIFLCIIGPLLTQNFRQYDQAKDVTSWNK